MSEDHDGTENIPHEEHVVHEEPDQFIETYFEDGPLGVTLRRKHENGIVFIFEIIPNSQAIDLNVLPNDELWAVGDSEIGETPLDKEAWNGLITFIKQSSRPLKMIWRRRPNTYNPEESCETSQAGPSPDYLELQKLIARLVVKDTSSRKAIDPSVILKEGRRIIKTDDFSISSKSNSINWIKTNMKKRLILMNDILLLLSPLPGNVYNIDNIIELQTCKIRSLGHAFKLEGTENQTQDADPKSIILSFDLIWPGGEIELIADSAELKDSWVMAIYTAICDYVPSEGKVLGWRHQYMLGSMHSAVLRREEDRIRELILLCQTGKVDFTSIESQDEDGYTPLHYACILRLHSIVRILHEATADVTALDSRGLTPLHWAAMQLDDYSLSLLCSHVFDLEILDNENRSPLVIACIEGRDITGNTDPVLLKNCVSCMLEHKPNLHWVNEKGQNLLHYLAASWQYEAMELLLDAGGSDFVNELDSIDFMTPLHFAAHAHPLKKAIGLGMKILNTNLSSNEHFEPLNQPYGIDTMRALLKAGAKPNLKDGQGRTPLSILLLPESEIMWTKEELEPAIALLLSYGARSDEVTSLLIKNRFPDLNIPAYIEKWNSLPPLDCNKLEIRINQYEIIHILDEEQASSSSPSLVSSKVESSSKPSAVNAGCSLCGFQFTIFKRQHHCRLCNTICCDDCSKKRCLFESAQIRTCDSCFNRVLKKQEDINQKERISTIKPLTQMKSNSTTTFPSISSSNGNSNLNSSTNNSSNLTVDKEKEKKESLFGSSLFSRITSSNNDNTKVSTKATTGVAGTMATMNETHEKLIERGEKLSRLADRTDEMSNQANEFARLAKQLNEQQRSRWF